MVRLSERLAILTETRRRKMARSAHAYVRGSTAKFYEWLDDHGSVEIPSGPDIWICGDCHLGNLGPLADKNGRVEIQIRDLDQTVIGNPAHDLIRLSLSLASAARGSDLPGVVTARMIEAVSDGYQAALGGNFGEDTEEKARPDDIQALVERSSRRRWRHLALERLDTVEPKIPLGRRFWKLDASEKPALKQLFAEGHVEGMIRHLQGADKDVPIEIVDAAYWMKGCSSLGRLRYAVMLRVGKGKRASFCLMDVKEATKAVAPRSANAHMPRENALRVVTGARALSPHLGDRMIAGRILDRGVVIRELMPQDLKVEVERLSAEDAIQLSRYLAGIVGRAHGRQLSKADRASWRKDVRLGTGALDAPSWLWDSVVDLLAIHEAAYLDHCRRFALAAA